MFFGPLVISRSLLVLFNQVPALLVTGTLKQNKPIQNIVSVYAPVSSLNSWLEISRHHWITTQGSFFVVYFLALFGDWVQGPYEKGFFEPEVQVKDIFVCPKIQGVSSAHRPGLDWLWVWCSIVLPSCPNSHQPSQTQEDNWTLKKSAQPMSNGSPCIRKFES